MQHAREQLPSSQQTPAPSHQPQSHTHLSPPPHYSPPHYIPPSPHHSQISSFQTTFPVAPSTHVINDPTSHSSSRRSIPSLLQNQQYQHQQPLSTDYPPYASQTPHPYFHQSHLPANDNSFQPSGPHMLYMQTPPPAQPPYYPYPPPPIHVQPSPDHLYQHLRPTNAMPRAPAEHLDYQKDHIVHQTYPPDPAMRPPSSARGHTFENENMPDPNRSLPTNISTTGNTPKDHNNFKPLTSLPPLPSHATSHSFYSSPQGMQNMTLMMPPSRSVLSAVPYHPSTHMSPSGPVQNMQQVAETGHFYNNPYHHNAQSGFPPEQHSQRTPVNNLQWQTHLAPAAHAHPAKDGGDEAVVFPPYYIGPDRVTRYYGQQSAPRKKRLQWTPQLHEKFVKAVEEFGVEKAVPKLLLQAMNVPGLTRENVASHLQKYRESMRKRKFETERSHRGMKSESKELEEMRTASDVETKDEAVGEGKLEGRTDEDEQPLEGFTKGEGGDSAKRVRDIETGTSETVDNKRQKAASDIHKNEVLKGTELTKQEVESYARVRARVDEALQLQTPPGRAGQSEPDVS